MYGCGCTAVMLPLGFGNQIGPVSGVGMVDIKIIVSCDAYRPNDPN